MGPMKLANRWPIYSPGYRGKTNLFHLSLPVHNYGEEPDDDLCALYRVRAKNPKQAIRKLRKRLERFGLMMAHPWRKIEVLSIAGDND